MRKTVLVHGYVRLGTVDALRSTLGDYHVVECGMDGGYMLTLATNEPVDEQGARRLLDVIYDNETESVQLHAEAGLLNQPVTLVDLGGRSFEFLGVVHGHEDTGSDRYQE